MFKMILSDVDLLKNSISIIAEIIDEGVFHVDQNGISSSQLRLMSTMLREMLTSVLTWQI